MRPGQQAPESLRQQQVVQLGASSFNEARAASPGIRAFLASGIRPIVASMRPGQQAPESFPDWGRIDTQGPALQ